MDRFTIFDKQNNGKVVIVLLAITATLMLTAASNKIIIDYFQSRVIADDIIFRLISVPQSHYLEYYTDFVILLMLGVTIWSWKDELRRYFPYLATNVTLFYCLRAIINVLTPLQRPLGEDVSHGIFRNVAIQYGMFPSGHLGITFLFFLLTMDRVSKNSRNCLAVLILIQALAMVITRGHYSIDVVGGVLLAFFVFKVLEPYKEKLVFVYKTE